VPYRGNAMLHRGFHILLRRSSVSVPKSRERDEKVGGSIFQTTDDKIARVKNF